MAATQCTNLARVTRKQPVANFYVSLFVAITTSGLIWAFITYLLDVSKSSAKARADKLNVELASIWEKCRQSERMLELHKVLTIEQIDEAQSIINYYNKQSATHAGWCNNQFMHFKCSREPLHNGLHQNNIQWWGNVEFSKSDDPADWDVDKLRSTLPPQIESKIANGSV